ncbi:MBL fold metallo-hydrolase, partial [Bacteroidota bacterium]
LSEGFYNISFDFQLRPNNLVYTGKDGILIVDTGHEDKANDLMETIKSISKNNISYVINSHLNHDHIGGNKICGEYAEMINYKNMSELLNRKVVISGNKVIKGANNYFYDKYYILNFEEKKIFLIPQIGIHSEEDILIYFPDDGIVHTGDLYLSQSFPAIRNVKEYLEILNRMIEVFPDNTKFIPGHGKISSKKDLKKYRKMLLKTIEVVREKKKTINNLEELIKQKPLKKWSSWGEFLSFLNIDSWTNAIYRSY